MRRIDAPLEVALGPDSWAACPACGIRFSPGNVESYRGDRHVACGQRLVILGPGASAQASGLGRPAEPVWCVAANVVLERHFGPGRDARRGTRHFAPGAKVYAFQFYWGMAGEDLTVIGRHRGSHRYISLTMRAAHLANWRAELAYSPYVIERVLAGGEFSRFPRGSPESRVRAEEIAAIFNARGAARQPFSTRPLRA